MIELPEAINLSRQINETLAGKRIDHVFNATKPHKFAFYNGDPLEYNKLLEKRIIKSAKAFGMFVDIFLDDNTILNIGDGTNIKYGSQKDEIPPNYQLLIGFSDDTFLIFTIAMYGFIGVYPDGIINNKYHKLSFDSISPLDESYDINIFNELFLEAKKDYSVKALLATEQRIPGVGNGVLQDILFNSKINPKRKISTLTENQKNDLFNSLKSTLKEMTIKGGRDTQTDLFGKNGGYKTILSSKTYKEPCKVCGVNIVKESYMGGTVYYCPVCQI
ncbi:MAG: endonuclease VIII [Bacteroidales bacterium]|jgi:formamidopyrimidine-DNA glycosylase|nr:endonuclease VIII [Bacteroidales bacterium]